MRVRLWRWVKASAPVLLDVAAFAAIVIGTARLWGDWGWLAAGVLLVLAGLRASS